MKTRTWLERLGAQLPGWFVWHSVQGWWAAPMAPEPTRSNAEQRLAAYRHPYRLGPYRTAQELRADASIRYGAGDHCETCGAPWEQCGHRQDETKTQEN